MHGFTGVCGNTVAMGLGVPLGPPRRIRQCEYEKHRQLIWVPETCVLSLSHWSAASGTHHSFHHCTPRIRQFSPLPMPQKATRCFGSRKPRSSAMAAVIGRLTVPMLPRYS